MDKPQASRARDNGVYVIPVAFSDGGRIPVSKLELSLLGANRNAYRTVRDDDDLINLVDSLNAVICPGSPDITTPTYAPAITTTTAPSTATTAPVTATTAPVTGTTSLVTGTTTPVTGTTSLVTGTTAPVTGSTSSVTGTTAPVTGSTSSVTGTTAPVDATTTPVDATTTPDVGTTLPVAGTTASVTTTTPTPPACQGLADIVIAIDDSASTRRDAQGGGTEVAPGQFELAEYYIQNSLLNTENINIGLIAHSNTGRVLSGFSNDSTVLNASLTFTPQYSISNTGAGLDVSTDLHLDTGRAGADKFTILLLNSRTSDPFGTLIQASRARNNGVHVVPVAFSDSGSIPVSTLELRLLGANRNAYFTVRDDADLMTLVDSITAVVCPG
ncbi:hypothetical protein ElyMa_002141500 [Elysia marginata]|uniref:VWFA domain-containing protein n=1 Tax=Elysia marginata TaxID=1093978 RepID=A0AAV4FLM8_9GAST|nr:hypothetical protein ElyMa_002141500 [Elysia marginata]